MMLRRRMMMAQGEAALAYGCYIQDTTGKLWKAGTWDGSATFNGVAVYTEECAFVIRQGAEKKVIFSFSVSVSASYPEYSSEEAAMLDFDGEANTTFVPSSSAAKKYVEDNPFPDGTVGHIPSLGEWVVAYRYKDEVDALFVEAMGSALSAATYLSSTLRDGAGKRGSSAEIWVFDWSDGSVLYGGGATGYYTRPFCKLI